MKLLKEEIELSDEELVNAAHKYGEFSYLSDPAEDIYSLDDGQPL